MDIDDTVDDDGTQHSMFETQAKTIAVAVGKANIIPPQLLSELAESSALSANTPEYRALVERLDRLEKQQTAIIMSHAELLNNQTNVRCLFLDNQKEMKEFFMAQLGNLMTLLKEGASQPQPSQLENYRSSDAEIDHRCD
ncbi:hypothetical protein CsatA_008943 [Cannabis sativa]